MSRTDATRDSEQIRIAGSAYASVQHFLRPAVDGRRVLRSLVVATIAVCLSVVLGAKTAAADPPGEGGVAPDAMVEQALDREFGPSAVPGVAYAVVDDGEVTAAGARGVTRAADDTAVTPDTPFLIGSVSKSFTALAIMQLVEAGRIDLDGTLATYLGEFAGHRAEGVTVRQLLTHTSGYSTLQGNQSEAPEGGTSDTLAGRVAQLTDVDPAHPPGERWEYSNTNYLLLGRIVEVVSGQSFQRYVDDNVLEPIGMAHSFVADGTVHDDMAVGHTPWFGTKRPLPSNVTPRSTAPAGGIVASAADVALYLQTLMNGRDDVLSAEGKKLMLSASAASPSYGFGWFIDSSMGTVWHSGLTPGVESLATMTPTEHKAVIVLVNGSSGVGFGETAPLLNAVTTAALGLGPPGDNSRWPQQTLFLGLALLPIIYLLAIAWAWWRRARIRAKSGPSGLFSLWFPLLTTLVTAWVMLVLVPNQFGAPLSTITLYQPDLGLLLILGAATGLLWAAVRLVIAYAGRADRPSVRPQNRK